MILCIRRDLKFEVRGSKFRKPRTADLKPRTLVRPAIRAFHAFLATGAAHEQTD
jgi:hypothetical protein